MTCVVSVGGVCYIAVCYAIDTLYRVWLPIAVCANRRAVVVELGTFLRVHSHRFS